MRTQHAPWHAIVALGISFLLPGCVRAGFGAHDGAPPDGAPPDGAPPDGATFTLVVSPTSWSTRLRGQQAFRATAVYSSGHTLDVTESVSWSSAAPAIVSIGNTAGTRGRAQARSLGTTKLTAKELSGKHSAVVAVTVTAATLLVQWGGDSVGGHGTYDPLTGKLLKALSRDGRHYRGLLALPGGFITVGTDPLLKKDFVGYLSNDGGAANLPLILGGSPPDQGMQAITQTRDGRYFVVPQFKANVVYLFNATGHYIGHFGKGSLSRPFRAVELDNGSLVVTSEGNGRLVLFPRTATGFGSGSILASSFVKPFGIDYCRPSQRLFVSDIASKKVYSCSTTGSCITLADHALNEPRVLQIDLNASDCSFFLGYRASSTSNKLARIRSDGTIEADFATMPAGMADVFAIEFLVPPNGT